MTPVEINELIVSGRACPAIPHYPRLLQIVRKTRWEVTQADCKHLVRPVVAELQAKKVKATLGAYTKHLDQTFRVYNTILSYRKLRKSVKKHLSLDERIVDRLYKPYVSQIKDALTSNDKNATLTIKRGEPGVQVRHILHGHGWGEWTEIKVTVTLQKGWSHLAKQGMHIFPKLGGQQRLLVAGFEPERQLGLFDNDFHAMFKIGKVKLVKRGVGTKTLTEPLTAAFHAGLAVVARDIDSAVKKLEKVVFESVTARLT